MKTIRIWFLLLLAVLLPIRGAVAAAMLCPVGSSGMQSELRIAQDAHHHDMDHQEAAHDHGGAGHHDGHDHSAVDKCNMCSAFCSLTPLVSNAPQLPEPAALPSVKFPDFSTPAPSFLSDRQERPPRTI
ncbi:DUF2946 family protein [Pelomonas sp. Root1444]|uniref:DUF2946 family protein n=1 Tax=Pelomonas sp. Root1444 TaxID=1736464 RepID=UPI0007032892|nr:DUF2946 family protein [Pelomonas sp. Root1444]KQY80864.1 hypothetical protein ASD35_03175 [Pelomonas sp. Root1444]